MKTKKTNIFAVALTALLVLAFCPAAPAVDSNGLVAHWTFDEGEGTTAYDSVGTNHGMLVNGPTWTTGLLGGALRFDGLDDYVGLPDNDPIWLPENDFTLALWVCFHRDSLVERETLLDLNWAGSQLAECRLGYGLFRSVDSEAVFDIITGGGDENSLVASEDIVKAQWYHIVAVRKGTWQEIYFNGALDTNGVCSPDAVDFTGTYDNDEVHIGKYNRAQAGDSYWEANATIDDVRIYEQALSVEQVQQLYLWDGNTAYPMFADAIGGDYHLKSERGRYWPEHDVWVLDGVTSPCVDGGDPNVEPSDEPMPNGGRLNTGAYGNTPYASMSEWTIPEDTNRDGVVNWLDFAMLAGKWLEALGWAQ